MQYDHNNNEVLPEPDGQIPAAEAAWEYVRTGVWPAFLDAATPAYAKMFWAYVDSYV